MNKQDEYTRSLTREEKATGAILIYTIVLLIGFALYLGGLIS